MNSILCCPHTDRILPKLPALHKSSGVTWAWRRVRSEKCHNFNMTLCTTGKLRSREMNWEGRTARMRWEIFTYKNFDMKIWNETITREPCRRYKDVIKLIVKSNCVCVCVCVCIRAREREIETIRSIAVIVRTPCRFSRVVRRLYSEEYLSPIVLVMTLNFP